MTVEKLIEQYKVKIEVLENTIVKINGMIKERRDSKKDISWLLDERQRTHRDRQIYFQFTKDLEDLKLK